MFSLNELDASKGVSIDNYENLLFKGTNWQCSLTFGGSILSFYELNMYRLSIGGPIISYDSI